MKKNHTLKQSLKEILYAVLAIILLATTLLTMYNYIYLYTNQQAMDELQIEAYELKNLIELQTVSDRENLVTMANLAAKLYAGGESYDILFNSFQEIGLFTHIGMLLPDNTFITKMGTLDASEHMNFEEEVQKGAYLSGRVTDLYDTTREVVRSAVPVKIADGSTVAMLYGVINLNDFRDKYTEQLKNMNADLMLVENSSGNYIINTKHNELGNIAALSTVTFDEKYSFGMLSADLMERVSGYTMFIPHHADKFDYVYYIPLEVADWTIFLLKPEHIIFAGAKSTGSYMGIISALIILIMFGYILVILIAERKNLKISTYSSNIRKLLLEMNQDFNKIYEALQTITLFAKSRSAFIVDTYGEDYNFVLPRYKNDVLSESDRQYFIEKLLNYAAKHRNEHGVDVYFTKISQNYQLKEELPEFYNFIKSHRIEKIHFTVITTNNSNISLLGVVNPQSNSLERFLKDIAVCFSMAVYNKKHLIRTETMALTDSLTNVANRMAYKRDVRMMDKNYIKKHQPSCIYIDVNELNYYNNTYGHAAGDQMLMFIAETLKSEFPESMVYRMGGDEFLIFTTEIPLETIKEKLKRASLLIEEMKYHISVGIKETDDTIVDIEDLLNKAEKLMYEEKSKYYQQKNNSETASNASHDVNALSTGISAIDSCLSVLSHRFRGIYNVSLDTDTAVSVLAPANYFQIPNGEHQFSGIMKQYIHDYVNPEFHRVLLHFLKYDILREELNNGNIPTISFSRYDGGVITLSIYPAENSDNDTLWVFEKKD